MFIYLGPSSLCYDVLVLSSDDDREEPEAQAAEEEEEKEEDDDDATEEEEVEPTKRGRKSTGSLRIKLPLFSPKVQQQRKSKREKKPRKVGETEVSSFVTSIKSTLQARYDSIPYTHYVVHTPECPTRLRLRVHTLVGFVPKVKFTLW